MFRNDINIKYKYRYFLHDQKRDSRIVLGPVLREKGAEMITWLYYYISHCLANKQEQTYKIRGDPQYLRVSKSW